MAKAPAQVIVTSSHISRAGDQIDTREEHHYECSDASEFLGHRLRDRRDNGRTSEHAKKRGGLVPPVKEVATPRVVPLGALRGPQHVEPLFLEIVRKLHAVNVSPPA